MQPWYCGNEVDMVAKSFLPGSSSWRNFATLRRKNNKNTTPLSPAARRCLVLLHGVETSTLQKDKRSQCQCFWFELLRSSSFEAFLTVKKSRGLFAVEIHGYQCSSEEAYCSEDSSWAISNLQGFSILNWNRLQVSSIQWSIQFLLFLHWAHSHKIMGLQHIAAHRACPPVSNTMRLSTFWMQQQSCTKDEVSRKESRGL